MKDYQIVDHVPTGFFTKKSEIVKSSAEERGLKVNDTPLSRLGLSLEDLHGLPFSDDSGQVKSTSN